MIRHTLRMSFISTFFVICLFGQDIQWVKKSPLPLAIRNGSAVACGEHIYFMGGYCQTTPERFEVINFEYTPQTDTWNQKAPLPTGRSNFTLVTAGEKIFAMGGDPFSGKNEQYDPQTDTWVLLAPMPTPRQHLYGTVLDDKIYLIGGLQEKSGLTSPSEWNYQNVSAKNEVYDIATDTWQELAPLPTPRHDSHAVACNGKIYVIGGMGKPDSLWASLSVVEMYDPQNDVWETKANLPEPRDGFGIVVIDGKIYILGGFNGKDVVDTIYRYDPADDTWSLISQLPTRTKGSPGYTVVGNTVYLIGGCDKNYTANATVLSGSLVDESSDLIHVLIIKAAGDVEGQKPEGVDAITEATSVGRNIHVVADALHKVLQSNGVKSEVVPFNDTKRIQEILKDSTVSFIVFAGPAYSSQFPQQLKDVVPKLKDYILQNKIRCTSMTTCRFLDSGGRTVKSFNEGLNDLGIQTIDGLVIHHEYEDPDWESKVKAFGKKLQRTLQEEECES